MSKDTLTRPLLILNEIASMTWALRDDDMAVTKTLNNPVTYLAQESTQFFMSVYSRNYQQDFASQNLSPASIYSMMSAFTDVIKDLANDRMCTKGELTKLRDFFRKMAVKSTEIADLKSSGEIDDILEGRSDINYGSVNVALDEADDMQMERLSKFTANEFYCYAELFGELSCKMNSLLKRYYSNEKENELAPLPERVKLTDQDLEPKHKEILTGASWRSYRVKDNLTPSKDMYQALDLYLKDDYINECAAFYPEPDLKIPGAHSKIVDEARDALSSLRSFVGKSRLGLYSHNDAMAANVGIEILVEGARKKHAASLAGSKDFGDVFSHDRITSDLSFFEKAQECLKQIDDHVATHVYYRAQSQARIM